MNIALSEQEVWSPTMCLPTQWYMETPRECVDGYAPVAQNWTMYYTVLRVELCIAGGAKSSSKSEDKSHKLINAKLAGLKERENYESERFNYEKNL